MALLVLRVVLDLLGGDRPIALREGAELQLPDRQHAQPVVADDPDIELASLDIFLRDRGGADALVNEFDALDELVVAVDDRSLRNAI